ncbi:MAG TPA: DUF882 domain-containing protein [Polyangiaceae bacterium]|nr:DUF882 domain-containing protein [Polyangiaceae bacterium]
MSRFWAAFVGVAVSGLSAGDAAAKPKAGPHPNRISAKSASASADHGRRRKGDEGDAKANGDQDRSAAGEVVGGVAGKPRPKGKKGGQKGGSSSSQRRVARVARPRLPCNHDAVPFERGFGGDVQPVVLTRCDGQPAAHAVEQLSVIVRPMSAPKPTLDATPIRHGGGEREWLPGVKLVHEGLVIRLQRAVDHFQAKKVTVVSGYRPTSLGSFHQSARAVDFHLDGVSNEALVAFCRTLGDTGCGYYPNSSFVHMDVRAAHTGHVYWIDASGPGELARYVSTWPPRDTARGSEIPRPDPAAPSDEQTHPDSQPELPLGASDTKVDARTTAPLSAGDGKDDPFAP